MRTLGDIPGLPGCFVAGVFSAALSSMSTAMNSMAAVVLEDFYKTFWTKPLTERQTNIMMKAVVIVTGSICLALVFVVEKLGSVLQLAMSLGAITNGPSLGIFCIGLLLPWVNTKGMMAGGVASIGFMSWIILGAQAAIATGRLNFNVKPLTVEGCTYDFNARNMTTIAVDLQSNSDVFILFRISYLWYTLLGCLISMLVSLPVSYLTGANDLRTMDHRLLSPIIRRFMPEQTLCPSTTEITLVSGYKAVELEIIPNNLNGDHKSGLES